MANCLQEKFMMEMVQELNLDSQWIVESRGTKKVFSQCEDSISTILGDQHQDTFTFQKNGTIGLEIFLWQLQLQNIVQTQTSFDIESIISYMQLGEEQFIELDYKEALMSYFNVLTLDPKNQQAKLGLGNCLAYLKCKNCLIIFKSLQQDDPKNDEYKFYMARGLNLLKKFKDAQKILNQLEKISFRKKSYVQQEIAICYRGLETTNKPLFKQQQIILKRYSNNSTMIQLYNLQEDESLVEEHEQYIYNKVDEYGQENNDLDNLNNEQNNESGQNIQVI